MYGRPPPKAEIKGLDSVNQVELNITLPPVEFSTCVNGFKAEFNMPEITEEFKFNGWWLVASRMGVNRLTPEKPVYFYWATKVAEDEIGMVPANFSTDKLDVSNPANLRVRTEFAVLPYIWVDQLAISHPYPNYPQECKKN